MKKKYKFNNPYSSGLKHGLFDIILWKIGVLKDKKKKLIVDKFVDISDTFSYSKNKPTALWVNHSTFLININGVNILTDPVWSKKCSPFKFIGPSRLHKPSVLLDNLPKIDYVLISHNHYDHLDKNSVKKLFKLFPEIKWIIPSGVKKWFSKNGIFNVFELSWWEDLLFKDIKITFVPAQHFSGRYIFDYNNSLWGGFVVEENKTKKKFYFAGDTAYNKYNFKEIGSKFIKMDLSLIPIGAYIPRAFTKSIHIDPYEAVKIHKEVNSKFSIGMHWRTFKLSDEPKYLPPHDLKIALSQINEDPLKFIAINPGSYVNW